MKFHNKPVLKGGAPAAKPEASTATIREHPTQHPKVEIIEDPNSPNNYIAYVNTHDEESIAAFLDEFQKITDQKMKEGLFLKYFNFEVDDDDGDDKQTVAASTEEAQQVYTGKTKGL